MSHVTSVAPEAGVPRQAPAKKKSRFPLATQILLSLILGGVFGYFFPSKERP